MFDINTRLEELRAAKMPSTSQQPRVVTVRMTVAMHERLRDLAFQNQVSMNQLCLAAIEGAEHALNGQSDRAT